MAGNKKSQIYNVLIEAATINVAASVDVLSEVDALSVLPLLIDLRRWAPYVSHLR